MLGNGLAVIDFSSRIGDIHNEYEAGGDWERKMFVESLSFSLSASAGIAAAHAGTAALGFLVAATPVGWVGLLVAGIIVAGAAGASITMNSYVQQHGDAWYDGIMSWISGIL